jgi:predicted O-methyltransferase YrrM
MTITESDFALRGWDVLASFAGEGALQPDLLSDLQSSERAQGSSDFGARNLLHALILSTRPKLVVEIGAHTGAGAAVIGAALRANGFGKSFHLEPQQHRYELLRGLIEHMDLHDYSFPLQMYSTNPSLPALVDREADLIFLDAGHNYSSAYENLCICDGLLSAQGLILISGVGASVSKTLCEEQRGGVRQAAIDFVDGRHDYSILFLEHPLWLNPFGMAIISRKPADQRSGPWL